jgi:hypothetical protein
VFVCPLVLLGLTYYIGDPQGTPLYADVSNPTQATYAVDSVELRIDRVDSTDGSAIHKGVLTKYSILRVTHVAKDAVVGVPIDGPWSTDVNENIGDVHLSCHEAPIAS